MNRMLFSAILAAGILGTVTSSSLMAKDATATTQPTTKHAGKWVCPMGDGGTATQPGKCPKCGMKMQKEKAAKHEGDKKPAMSEEDHKGHDH